MSKEVGAGGRFDIFLDSVKANLKKALCLSKVSGSVTGVSHSTLCSDTCIPLIIIARHNQSSHLARFPYSKH